jgi:hypothetical protein
MVSWIGGYGMACWMFLLRRHGNVFCELSFHFRI